MSSRGDDDGGGGGDVDVKTGGRCASSVFCFRFARARRSRSTVAGKSTRRQVQFLREGERREAKGFRALRTERRNGGGGGGGGEGRGKERGEGEERKGRRTERP